MATKLWVGTDTAGDWSVAANWSPSGVPGAGDDVFLTDSSQDVDAGLDQSAIVLASLAIDQSYTGDIGTSAAYLQIDTAILDIGQHYGAGSPHGSGRIKIDLDATACVVTIHNSGTSTDNKPAILLKALNAATTIEVRKGSVGIAYLTGETTTVATIKSNYISQKLTDADVYIGSGVTLTTLSMLGGTVDLLCAATTVTNEGGTLTTGGSGAIITLNADGGTVNSNSTGTITTMNITGGTVDFTKSQAARTVTTLKVDAPGIVKYDSSIVTLTNKVQPFSTTGIITYQAA